MNQSLAQPVSVLTLIKFSMPTIISNIFMGLYSTVDGVFVSRLINTDALSAVNLVFPIIMVALAVGNMFGSGIIAIAAKKLGEGKPKEARENISLIAALAFFLSLIFSVICLIYDDELIYFLGSDERLFQYCKEYLAPSIYFLPLCVLGMLFQLLFISIGRPGLGLLTSVFGGVANMVLDYLLIAVLHRGIAGAAIASGVGYALPAGIGLLYFLFNRKNSLYLVFPRFDGSAIVKSCTNGLSEMFNAVSGAIVTFLFNKLMMELAGADGVAAVTIILYSYTILGAAFMGYSMGIAPMISFRYGMKDVPALKKIYRSSLLTIGIASAVITLFSQIAAVPLVRIFTDANTPVYALAVPGFRLFSLCFLFEGASIFASSMFTALSDGRVSGILSSCRNFVFILALLIAMPAVLGVLGVWLAVPASELLSAILAFYFFRKKRSVYNYA